MGIVEATTAFAERPVENFLPDRHTVLDAEHAWWLEIEDGKADLAIDNPARDASWRS